MKWYIETILNFACNCRHRVLLFLLLSCLSSAFTQNNIWKALNDPDAGPITALIVASDNTLFIGTDSSGVFRSTNDGQTWESKNTGLANLHIRTLVMTPNGILVAGTTSNLLYRSTDQGTSWSVTSFSLTPVTAMTVTPLGYVYIGTDHQGLYRSVDDGIVWSRVDYYELSAIPIWTILVTPNLDVIVGGDVYLKWYPRGGTFWHSTFNWTHGTSSLALSPSNRIFVGADGVYHLWDDLNGAVLNDGLSGNQITALTINSNGRLFAATQDSGVFESPYTGPPWSRLTGGISDSAIRSLVLSPDETLYAGSTDGKVYKSVSSTKGLIPPQLVSPLNDLLNAPRILTLQWRTSVGTDLYRYQVATDPSFSEIVFDATAADTTATVSGLGEIQSFFWRVRSESGPDTSVFSLPRKFITGPLPSKPALSTLIYPPDSAQNLPLSVTMRWHALPNTVFYTLQVSVYIDFFRTTVSITTSDTFYQVNGFAANRSYYWHVRSTNIAGEGPFSDAKIFSTITPSNSEPILVKPENGDSNLPVNLVLSWGQVPRATSYDLQFGTDPGFNAGIMIDDSAIAATNFNITGLGNDSKYYWRIRGRNEWGIGPYSYPWNFTTIVQIPDAPELLSPIDGSVDRPTYRCRFVWKKIPRATMYTLQIGEDSSFSADSPFLIYNTEVRDTNNIIGYLRENHEYYWRVAGLNIGGRGGWSPTFRFKTIHEGNLSPGRPDTLMILPNSPNPFNGSTYFVFGLPAPAQFSITIYNILGQKVITLENDYLPAGYFIREWDASRMASGTYICIIQADNVVQRNKMVLLK